MRVHFLGIAGTFMANLAILAKQIGFKVTGQDQNIYPPMSNQLLDAAINYIEGYEITDLPKKIDLIIIGNVMRRGMPIIEHILNKNLPMISAPAFFNKFILNTQHNLVITGTHGKTTTSSILTWILKTAKLNPGYLIGGIIKNFPQSANIGKGKFFVIEGDEYDCAFFDKRSKFMHYKPNTLIINNIEYDHADIFKDLNAIITQFHHLIKIVPSNGTIIYNRHDANIKKLLSMGCWSNLQSFNMNYQKNNYPHPYPTNNYSTKHNLIANLISMLKEILPLYGNHNLHNALAASLAAINIGVNIKDIKKSLSSFPGVARRLEYKGCCHGISIYDDFAHHPTAIKETINGLSLLINKQHQQDSNDNNFKKNIHSIVAVVDLGSNTLKMGVNNKDLIKSLQKVSKLYLYANSNKINWNIAQLFKDINKPGKIYNNITTLLSDLPLQLQPKDYVLIMSNGKLATLGDKLIDKISNVHTNTK